MKTLLEWITASVSFRNQTVAAQAASHQDLRDDMFRSEPCWDEVLISAMYDETARRFLDHMGPRC
jgi:hypothetical protein